MARPTIDSAFFQHLTAEDELGVVLRAQIHLEASLSQFIDAVVPFPDQLPRMQYEGRLRLACAFGLNHEYFAALKFLGDLRNRFAHSLDVKLNESTLNEWFAKLPSEGQEVAMQAYEATNKRTQEANRPDFRNLPPQDRFVLIAVVLKGFVATAAHQPKGDRDGAGRG
jgi:hypothetical protein